MGIKASISPESPVLVVLAIIISGLVGFVIGVTGVDVGGVIGAGAGELEQPANNTSAATIIKMLLNKANFLDICFNEIIPSFKFFDKITPNKKSTSTRRCSG